MRIERSTNHWAKMKVLWQELRVASVPEGERSVMVGNICAWQRMTTD